MSLYTEQQAEDQNQNSVADLFPLLNIFSDNKNILFRKKL
uniref:Uncharacterized protein n=1 Tax=Rhizophora mucronata TaxID=61149 RepID=A0A2P2Q4G0_RHIMU